MPLSRELRHIEKLLNTTFGWKRYSLTGKKEGGSFYKVYTGIDKKKGKKCIIKKALDRRHAINEIEFYKREAPLLHEHIVELFEIIQIENDLYIIMEQADDNLEGLIDPDPELNYFNTDERIERFLEHVIKGLMPLEARGLFHGDLHPRNVLYFEDKDSFKICDFGLTRPKGKRFSKTKGIISYRAPELESLGDEKVKSGDIRSDFYSIGAILYFILNGDTMFSEDSDEVRLKKRDWNFIRRRIDETLKHVNVKFKRILYKTLHPDPKERYQSCDEFLKAIGKSAEIPGELQRWINKIMAWLEEVSEYGTHSPTDVRNIIQTRRTLREYIQRHGLNADKVIEERIKELDRNIIQKRIQDYIVMYVFVRYDLGKRRGKDDSGRVELNFRYEKWLNEHEDEREFYYELVKPDCWDFTGEKDEKTEEVYGRARKWRERYGNEVIHPDLNEVGDIVPQWLRPYIKKIRTHVRPHPKWREWLEEDGWDWLQNVVLEGR